MCGNASMSGSTVQISPAAHSLTALWLCHSCREVSRGVCLLLLLTFIMIELNFSENIQLSVTSNNFQLESHM